MLSGEIALKNNNYYYYYIMICGDLNAPLIADGSRCVHVRGKPNSNSEALQAFINLHDLIAANCIMRQKRIKLPTFDGPRGRCTCLDWIFGRNSFRQCVRKVMNIKTTVLASDHRLLLVDYLLLWPSSKKRMASEIDWSYIALPSTRTDLVMSTRQFQEKGFDFIAALSSTAEISLPKSIAQTRVRSWNNNVELRKAWSQVQRAHHKFGKYSSQHSAALERLDRTHAFLAETHAMVIIDDIQSQIYEHRTAAAWKSINEFCGHNSTPLSCIKASSIDQVKEKLQQHYANVLNRPPPPLPINDDDDVITVTPDLDPSKVTGPITTAELRAALSTSKLSSSSGPDGFPVIALRIKEFKDDILNTINQSLKMVDSEYNIPSHWKHSIIVSIPKKGSSLSLDNQRTSPSCVRYPSSGTKFYLIESSR